MEGASAVIDAVTRQPDWVWEGGWAARGDMLPAAISVAVSSMRVNGRSPSRTTDAAATPISSSTIPVTTMSMSSSESSVPLISRRDTALTLYPPAADEVTYTRHGPPEPPTAYGRWAA